jgi:hypothetical protein
MVLAFRDSYSVSLHNNRLNVRRSSAMESLESMFGKPELLSEAEGNGWRPEKGADKVDAHKGSALLVQGLPPILQVGFYTFYGTWIVALLLYWYFTLYSLLLFLQCDSCTVAFEKIQLRLANRYHNETE